MGRKGSKKGSAELVVRLVELGSRALVDKCGMADLQARQAMREIAHELAKEYGGTYMYVPKDQELALNKRDMEIHARLQDGNANELAREFGLSVQQIYSINRYVREKIIRTRQSALPGFEELPE